MSPKLDLKGLWLLLKFIIFRQFLKGLGKKPTQGMPFLFLQSLFIPPSSLCADAYSALSSLPLLWSHLLLSCCIYPSLFYCHSSIPCPKWEIWVKWENSYSAVVAAGEWGKDRTAFQNSSPLISHKFWFLTMFWPINQIMEKLKKSREMNKVASYFKEVCKNGDL